MSFSNTTAQFKAELKHAPRKAGFLGVLLVVALFFAVKLVVNNTSNTPSQAEASTGDIYETDDPAETGVSNLSADFYTESPQSDSHLFDSDRKGKVVQLTRDLFSVNSQYFGSLNRSASNTSLVEDSQQSKQAELAALKEKIHTQAQSLVLEGILLGDRPAAIINGKVMSLKSEIDGFEIIKISEQSVDIRKKGITVRIGMKN